MVGSVKILYVNHNASSLVSAAGRISTMKGSADEIYGQSCKNSEDKNEKLIRKIMASGHESVLEHILLNVSFDNVSVFVEQFMIEFRLASFTVKSRRYVDFGEMGYFIPESMRRDDRRILLKRYKKHMDYLFEEYNFLIQSGIPKEDARFILPYSFRSNFYCSLNGRELKKIMNEMVYGRGSSYPELVALGQSLFEQCEELLPYIAQKKEHHQWSSDVFKRIEKADTGSEQTGGYVSRQGSDNQSDACITVLNGPMNPEQIICDAAALNYGMVPPPTHSLWSREEGIQKQILQELIKCSRKREFEQVHFTILFHRISLAGITHLVRHRMQAIVIPEYLNCCSYSEYVLPESIVEAGFADRYQEIFRKSEVISNELQELGLYSYDRVYLLLSGMTLSVMTTMNVHELYIFFKLRVCNRAQWEIRECADALLESLRKKHPVLFRFFGPACYADGRCPEGAMTCGRREETIKKYNTFMQGNP